MTPRRAFPTTGGKAHGRPPVVYPSSRDNAFTQTFSGWIAATRRRDLVPPPPPPRLYQNARLVHPAGIVRRERRLVNPEQENCPSGQVLPQRPSP